jgi:hypothetical protein
MGNFGGTNLSARLRVNYHGDYITNYNAVSAARSLYVRSRTVVNPSVGYEVRPGLTFGAEVSNFTNAHQIQYRGIRDQMALDRNSGTTITFSLTGRY